MDKDLTTISEFPQELRLMGYLPTETISKKDAKLIWPDRKKLSEDE